MRGFLLFLLALLGPGIAHGQAVSFATYRDAYIAALEASGMTDIRQEPGDAGTLTFKTPDGGEMKAFLDNGFRQYVENPGQLHEIVGRFVRIATGGSPDATAPLTADRLVALLRPSTMTKDFPPESPPVSRPFAGDLIEIIAIDGKETLRYANTNDLNALGLAADAAFSLAESNVLTRIGAIDEASDSGITITAADSGLATGLPVTPGYCAAGKPDRIYLLVDRQHFLSVLADDEAAARLLRQVRTAMVADQATMSSKLVKCSNGVWESVR